MFNISRTYKPLSHIAMLYYVTSSAISFFHRSTPAWQSLHRITVSVCLVRPDFHVEAIGPVSDMEADNHGQVKGYVGLYNFKHYFWVAKGSRLYGPKPQLTLNHSQSLDIDLDRLTKERIDYQLLRKLLEKPDTSSSLRIFTALSWFNEANNEANDQPSAIANLSIAFEALLSLPINEKTDRLTDAISLLLGRIPRLEVWARQFYDARSRIIHEGYAQQLRNVWSALPH